MSLLDLSTVIQRARQVPNKRALESLSKINPAASAVVSSVTSMASDISSLYAQVQLLKYGDDGSIEDTTDQIRSDYQKSVVPSVARSVGSAINTVMEVKAALPSLLTEHITEAGHYEMGNRVVQQPLLVYANGLWTRIEADTIVLDGTVSGAGGVYWPKKVIFTATPIGASDLSLESSISVANLGLRGLLSYPGAWFSCSVSHNGSEPDTVTVTVFEDGATSGALGVGHADITGLCDGVGHENVEVDMRMGLPRDIAQSGTAYALAEITPPSEKRYLDLEAMIDSYESSLVALKDSLDSL